MKKKVIATMLAATMIVTSAVPVAAAAPTSSKTANAAVYAPADIVDVLVPTDYEIAVNPLGINVTGNGVLNGKTQILSGTYVIQNRSTIPVEIEAAFTVTTGKTGTDAGAKAVIEADRGQAAEAGQEDVPAMYLGVLTSAKGASVTFTDSRDDKTPGTDGLLADGVASLATNSTVKVAKYAASPIDLTGSNKKASVRFALAAGPYEAKFTPAVKDNDGNVTTPAETKYVQSTKGSFDTVGFTFTGETSTDAAPWYSVTETGGVAPSVKVVYTLTEHNARWYAETYFSPTDKGIVQDGADVQAGSDYVFPVAPTITMTKATTDNPATIDVTKNPVTVLSLKAGAKAVTYKALKDFGTVAIDDEGVVTITPNASLNEPTYVIDKEGNETDKVQYAALEGLYQVTIGKQSFVMDVPAAAGDEGPGAP